MENDYICSHYIYKQRINLLTPQIFEFPDSNYKPMQYSNVSN